MEMVVIEVLTVQNSSFLDPHLPRIWWSPDPSHRLKHLADDAWPSPHRRQPPLAQVPLSLNLSISLLCSPLLIRVQPYNSRVSQSTAGRSPAWWRAIGLPFSLSPLVVSIDARVENPPLLACVKRRRGSTPF